ncbi:MAG: chaperonin GroEL [Clostridiales bacterium]|jgi:chaperonin GroEL|nr:chaperonin GroEL [Clostridiales bacterium]
MSKDIAYDIEFLRKASIGVNLLANSVKITLGASGRNVLLERPSASPIVANSGAMIANDMALPDDTENMGVKIIREAASKTNAAAGDGAATAIVLSQFILNEGWKNIAANANPIELRKGIQGATQVSAAAIRKLAMPAGTRLALEKVASVSANDPVLGSIVAEAMTRVGSRGVVLVEESSGTETVLDIKEGMQLERGYLSPEMVTDKDRMVAELENPYILITDQKIEDPQELIPIMEEIVEKDASLLVVADELEGAALRFLVMNIKNNVFKVAAVRAPAYGEGRIARMEDLALLTGGSFISKTLGLTVREATLGMLGRASSVIVGKDNASIVGGLGDKAAIEAWIKATEARIDKTDYTFSKQQLQDRLAKITAGVAVIKTGAFTAAEMKEKKLRVDNAVHTARAAEREGIVPGGGIAYLRIIPAVKAYAETLSGDRKTGAAIIVKALEAPVRQIAENAGIEGGIAVAQILKSPAGTGLNAITGTYENMMDAGIVDAAMVTRIALQSAASAAATLLTSRVGITETKKNNAKR